MIGPHRRKILDLKLHATWSCDLHAALDGRYGAFGWDKSGDMQFEGDDPRRLPPTEFWNFVEEHARDWLKVRREAGGLDVGT